LPLAGTLTLKILNMENTSMTHVFKHPKFYRIPRDKKDQAISCVMTKRRLTSGRAPDPGQSSKPQAPSSKRQASSTESVKPQATSVKPQA
jgi:hypothetical protein